MCLLWSEDFPKKRMLFSSKAIHLCKPSPFYLPNLEKMLWGKSNNAKNINVRVALFLERKPKSSLVMVILTLATLL